ncbi:MAG: hypothetical protein IPG75_10140 [Gemmatimonadetes bacterium]|nr:hypothetical protein [Gemmatimonadota bacterium]
MTSVDAGGSVEVTVTREVVRARHKPTAAPRLVHADVSRRLISELRPPPGVTIPVNARRCRLIPLDPEYVPTTTWEVWVVEAVLDPPKVKPSEIISPVAKRGTSTDHHGMGTYPANERDASLARGALADSDRDILEPIGVEVTGEIVGIAVDIKREPLGKGGCRNSALRPTRQAIPGKGLRIRSLSREGHRE